MNIIDKELAFVIHQTPLNENKMLAEILVANMGKLTFVVTQARMTRCLLQPFQLLQINGRIRGKLAILHNYEIVSHSTESMATVCLEGIYINELINRLTPSNAHFPSLFETYAKCLYGLLTEKDKEKPLRSFEYHLLDSTGNELQLAYDFASGNELQEDLWYHYETGSGATLAPLDEGERYRGRSLIALSHGLRCWDKTIARDCKILLHSILRSILHGRRIHTHDIYAFLNTKSPLSP